MSSSPSSDGSDDDLVFADFMSCLSSGADGLQKRIYSPDFDEILGAAKMPPVKPIRQKRGSQPYIPAAHRRNKKIKEKPVYTRRQVEDMFNIEEVLKRCHPNKVPNMGDIRKRAETPFNSTAFPEMDNLDISLSHVFSGLQNFLAEN
ncbi:hypothetical protein H0H92_000420 [Tricholoma furcatifolium]|nr:hypothetical protein H0H92_000420 [Tricholoma furcatifolium]